MAADDFGGVGESTAPPAGGAMGADDFGGFGESPAPPAGGAMAAGDFGGFGESTAPPAGGAMAADDFGGFGESTAPPAGGAMAADDFGGFGTFAPATGAVLLPATTSSASVEDEDGFGAFGSFAPTASAAVQIQPPTTASAASAVVTFDAPSFAVEDDGFGHFDVHVPPTSLQKPAAAATASAADTGLKAVQRRLLAAGRFEDALGCKLQMEALAQLAVQKQAYEHAKQEDDLEQAIHIKKVVLPRLQQQVQPDEVVRRWEEASGSSCLAEMQDKVRSLFGDEQAAPFVRNCPTELATLDLPAAAAKEQRVRAAYEVLLELSPQRQSTQLAQLDVMLGALAKTMRQVVEVLEDVPAHLSDDERGDLMRSPQIKQLVQGLLELRKLGSLMSASREWQAAFFVASAARAGDGKASVAAELDTLLQRSLTLSGAEEEIEPIDVQRLVSCPKPLAQRCALSLLPLRSEEFSELPPTALLDGVPFLAPAINFWRHHCGPDPPST